MYTYHLFSSMLRPRASGFCQLTDLIHLIIFMHQSQILDSILQPFIFFCFLCSLVLFFFARTCIYSTFCSKALLSDHFGECFLAFSLPWNILYLHVLHDSSEKRNISSYSDFRCWLRLSLRIKFLINSFERLLNCNTPG